MWHSVPPRQQNVYAFQEQEDIKLIKIYIYINMPRKSLLNTEAAPWAHTVFSQTRNNQDFQQQKGSNRITYLRSYMLHDLTQRDPKQENCYALREQEDIRLI